MEAAEQKLKTEQEEHAATKKERDDLLLENQNISTELKKAQKNLAEQRELAEQLPILKKEFEDYKKDAENEKKEQVKVYKKLEKRVANFTAEMDKVTAERDAEKQAKEKLQNAIDELRNKLAAMEKKFREAGLAKEAEEIFAETGLNELLAIAPNWKNCFERLYYDAYGAYQEIAWHPE